MSATQTTSFEFSDVHVHLQDKRFGASSDEVARYLDRARALGVRRFVCSGTSPADWNRTLDLTKKLDGVYPTFGTHPWHVGRISGDWLAILATLLDQTVAKDGRTRPALGEVGLDFAVQGCNEAVKQLQEDALRAQLDLASERALPVVLHSVRANDRVLKIMRQYSKTPAWLLHGWTATEREIDEALDLGAFFSFSQRSVHPNALRARATIAAVPRDRILLESDGPTPTPPGGYAGAPTTFSAISLQERDADGFLLAEPASLVSTAKEICAIRKTPQEDFFKQLALNERRFFQFWRVKESE